MQPETIDFYGHVLRVDEDGDYFIDEGLFRVDIMYDSAGWYGSMRVIDAEFSADASTPQAVAAALGGKARATLDALRLVLNAT